MIKSAKKKMQRGIREYEQLELLSFPNGGSFRLIGFGSRNPFLHSWGRILSPPSLREEIFFPYQRIVLPYQGLFFLFQDYLYEE